MVLPIEELISDSLISPSFTFLQTSINAFPIDKVIAAVVALGITSPINGTAKCIHFNKLFAMALPTNPAPLKFLPPLLLEKI